MMRKALLIFAAVLAIEGAWVLGAALLRTDIRSIPLDKAQIAQAKVDAFRARAAAWAGLVRGDLWAESIFARSYAADLRGRDAAQAGNREARKEAREDCDRALALAPIAPGLWALRALLEDDPSASLRTGASLEMAYYTGLNMVSVMPIRLYAAARSDALTNKAVQTFVQRDVELVLSKLPDLKPSLAAAYKDALPQNRALLTNDIQDKDPAFGALLRAQN